MLEVQKFIDIDTDPRIQWGPNPDYKEGVPSSCVPKDVVVGGPNGAFEHVGYMNKLFKTKKRAEAYYYKHNSHMRRINRHGASDWDPDTGLRYVVRRYERENLEIPPFEGDSEPPSKRVKHLKGSESAAAK